ncbi:hypothetical protein GV827_11875 [Sulfitobacter sp. JBTF-M27]|uniref:Uncharacterized protein n=1 Tax=Sulfitobacter sediminilitoris TaxID=2698830 RepID=A0A6P0CCM5_9RHOB|nr:hypothetical protein [Sulfitobacter sediminilitoris]NEK23100.1 hypothetical protein [Sulfitobacter sediminilitoris]
MPLLWSISTNVKTARTSVGGIAFGFSKSSCLGARVGVSHMIAPTANAKEIRIKN